MGRRRHALHAQTQQRRKDLVVRKRSHMTKCKKHNKDLCWKCVFERRPDLKPPGYYEAIGKLYEQPKYNDSRNK